jgi:hypothetical protein
MWHISAKMSGVLFCLLSLSSLRRSRGCLVDPEVGLDLLQGALLSFWVDEEDYEELDGHHCREEDEGEGVGFCRDDWEDAGDNRIHDPVGRGAHALSFGADAGGKDFCNVDPDDRALGDGEEDDEQHEEPHQQALVGVGVEDSGYAGKSDNHAH